MVKTQTGYAKLPGQSAQLANKHKTELARIHANEPDVFRLRDTNLSKGAMNQLVRAGVIQQVDRYAEPATYTLHEELPSVLEDYGLIDERGDHVGACQAGEDGILDCGGSGFRNEGSVLVCSECGTRTPVSRARERREQ